MARAKPATGQPAAAATPAAATETPPPPGRGDRARDMLFVTVVIASSTALYLSRLGFASDDWAFLGSLTTHGDLSAPGRSLEHDFAVYLQARPIQVVYQALLFGAFGPNPLGYHLVNTAVLALMAMLGYLVLRELGMSRRPAVAVALLYGLLPHYSTDRFWWSAFGYGAAMTLALASLFADLRAVQHRGAALWLWKATALAALAASALGFEVAIPLLAAAVPLLWYQARHHPEGPLEAKLGRAGAIIFLGSNLLVLAAIVAFKSVAAVGVGVPGSYLRHLARLALGSTATSFGSYGVGLPEATRWAAATVDGVTLAAGVALALAVGLYLGALGRQDASIGWPVRAWLRLVATGLLVFALGYGIFLSNARILFSSSGTSNRVAIAAAAGVAMIGVGLAGAVSAAVPRRWRSAVLAIPVAALCLSGFLIVHGLAASWAEAWERQQVLLADIRTRLPRLEPRTTIILDGVCPYLGPAIVFESNWDLAGALETLYDDPTVRADAVSANLAVGDDGLATRLYADHFSHYAYSPRLLVFDARDGALRPLPDAQAARIWWSTRDEPNCPRGTPGHGTTLFRWDGWYQRLERDHLWG